MAFNPQYKSSPPTLDEGQFSAGTVDNTGALRVTSADMLFSTSTIGNLDDEAWDGIEPEASVISILKACYEQLAIIAVNTTPGP